MRKIKQGIKVNKDLPLDRSYPEYKKSPLWESARINLRKEMECERIS